MSFPFGGHPRLSEYLHWAATEHGCTNSSGFTKIDGRMDTFVLIENPANAKHVYAYEAFTEFLTPSTVSYLDRRLGIKSPFPSIASYT